MRFLLPALLLATVVAAPAAAEVAMFSQRNFQGARYALVTESANMNFSPRSIRVVPGEAWQICPRPFFGGDCRTITEPNAKLNLPRAFSGMVRSARPVASPNGAPPPAVKEAAPPAAAPKQPKPEPAKPEPKTSKEPKVEEPKADEPKPAA
ncbi:MAG: hypothetical protein DI568_04625 [Sphingomonas sp.]|nr:MAG: hypothetical protein DI568_04625 [Sphingomonas sp.]